MADRLEKHDANILRRYAIWVGPVVLVFVLLFLDLDPGNPAVTRTAGVAALMAIWWITEAIPLAATALLPVVLFPLLGVLDGKSVAGHYFNHISLLYVGGFLVALAMQRWDLHKRIALTILRAIGSSPRRLLLGFMCATAFLSMWISNTASTMMMVTIAMAIIAEMDTEFGQDKVAPMAKALLLGVAYSASVGGMATLVGTPTNLSFARIYEIQFPDGREVTFARWFAFASPMAITLLAVTWLWISRRHLRNKKTASVDRRTIDRQLASLGRITFPEAIVLIVFCLLVVGWIFRKPIAIGQFTLPGWSGLFQNPDYINDGTVAITLALVLFVMPARRGSSERVLDWQTAAKLPWDIVLLFGGGFALASGFVESGLSAWLGNQLSYLGNANPLVVLMAVCLGMSLLTELTSNVATTEMVLPTLAAMAIAIEIDPLFLMVPATISSSCAFMMPVATPPNAIVFGAQRLTIPEMAKTGVAINMFGVLVIVLGTYWLGHATLGIDFRHVVP